MRGFKSLHLRQKKRTTHRVVLFFGFDWGFEPIKCNSPVDYCLPPAGWRQHNNFCQRQKCKSNPSISQGINRISKVYTNNKKRTTHRVVLFLASIGDLNRLNAIVRWTIACRQLDGGNTIIFAKGKNTNQIPPIGTENHPSGGPLVCKTYTILNAVLITKTDDFDRNAKTGLTSLGKYSSI